MVSVSRTIPEGAIAWLAALLLALFAARPARAQDRDQREIDAKKACLGGHPDKGIELLADLYTDTNDPTYIYNQGRCFEQNGRTTEAVTRFREYLRKATALSPDEHAQLQKHIDELETEAKVGAGPGAAPAPAPATGAVPPAPPPGVVRAATGAPCRSARGSCASRASSPAGWGCWRWRAASSWACGPDRCRTR